MINDIIQTIIASRQGQTEHRYEVLKSISFFIRSQSEQLETTNWTTFWKNSTKK